MTVSTTPDTAVAKRDALIEADYRAGIKPVRQIGTEHGLSHTAIQKMAKKRGWSRDLTAKVQAEADAKVARAAVAAEVAAGNRVTEAVIVEANASAQYEVRVAHRTVIQRTRRLLEGLLTELEGQLTDPAALTKLLEAAGDALSAEDRAALKAKLLAATGTGSRLAMAKQAAEALTRVVDLERQAFNIRPEVAEHRDDPLSLLLRQVMGQRTALAVVADDPAHQA